MKALSKVFFFLFFLFVTTFGYSQIDNTVDKQKVITTGGFKIEGNLSNYFITKVDDIEPAHGEIRYFGSEIPNLSCYCKCWNCLQI